MALLEWIKFNIGKLGKFSIRYMCESSTHVMWNWPIKMDLEACLA